MTRSKKIFLIAAVLFFLFLIWVIYDISRRTTFPGAKSRGERAAVEVTKFHSSPVLSVYPT